MQEISPWRPGPANPEITRDELHLWLARLDLPDLPVGVLYQTLSPDEQERARRFRFGEDRRRFVVGRGVLRTILGSYTGAPPAQLRFAYSPAGKPRFAPETGQPAASLSFNLSHSGELALYAICLDRRVGVDIEQFRPQVAEDPIAERFFSPQEVDALRSLPPDEQAPAFFRCWTRKEAYVKACGEGLAIPLNRFVVTLRHGEPATLLDAGDENEQATHWFLHSVDIAPGYEAAVAADSKPSLVRYWLFSFDT